MQGSKHLHEAFGSYFSPPARQPKKRSTECSRAPTQRSRCRLLGFTFIEVLAVLSIVALSTLGVLAMRDWATSNSRVAEAKGQIAAIQSGVQQWRPSNGVYTGVSIQALTSVASLPISWGDGSSINPWGGDVEVRVDNTDATRYIIRFTNIRVPQEGQRLHRDFEVIAEHVSFVGNAFEVTFQG
ncbi:type II secretion system protein [Aliidiomarina halalkaliphila]|uniref:type II secretion system protein n=1 Tax=Aliidiomarina halalkaliphila TaxID=2593535 RepID=UPI001E50750A|nr:type II secretion system protein [Aliidiomarina halalkaliphila]